ncbi:MAG: exodeoxyribonuclease VII large subunit [Thermoflavifilum sp.]|nr:exodeoxyribonuclease VII large subunit [Thermoflavifilum sp.]
MNLQSEQSCLSLYELASQIKDTIQLGFPERIWVRAEIHKLNYYPHSGHCYPDLVEKRGDKIVAEMRGLLWNSQYRRINLAFQRLTGEPLRDGLKVLCLVEVTFDTKRGIALLIHDIDPSYTLGDLEREKQQTIERLKQEGLFDRNRQLPLPLLPKRIAIISALTSRGYADFLNVISAHQHQYRIIHQLFPAWLQGDKAVQSIIEQLHTIREHLHRFDAVAIIRGGGGETGLSAYNDYALAKEVASFPLPVLTGIGHATNETVTEMVACVNCITPTKLAEFLLQHFDDFAQAITRAQDLIHDFATHLLAQHQHQLHQLSRQLRGYAYHHLQHHQQQLHFEQRNLLSYTQSFIKQQHTSLHMSMHSIKKEFSRTLSKHQQDLMQWLPALIKYTKNFFQHQHQQIDLLHTQVKWFDPENMLKKGFTITLRNGVPVASVHELQQHDSITTVFKDGQVESTISAISPSTSTSRVS